MACRILATNHTSFTVSDLDRSIEFFVDALGFELISKAPRDPAAIQHITGVAGAEIMTAFLQAPGHRLELIEYLQPSDRKIFQPRPCDTGFAHVAFDTDNIEHALAAVAIHGAVPVNSPWVIDKGPNAGRRVAYCRMWDGVTIEFLETTE